MTFTDLKILGFESFIIFNNCAGRINQDDILYRGFDIAPIIENILYALSFKTELKYATMINNLAKIQKMVEMAQPNDIVMTKFFNKIRSTHKQASNLGEKLTTLNIFLGVYPEYISNFDVLLETKKVVSVDDYEM